jgi:hypothetical protein
MGMTTFEILVQEEQDELEQDAHETFEQLEHPSLQVDVHDTQVNHPHELVNDPVNVSLADVLIDTGLVAPPTIFSISSSVRPNLSLKLLSEYIIIYF